MCSCCHALLKRFDFHFDDVCVWTTTMARTVHFTKLQSPYNVNIVFATRNVINVDHVFYNVHDLIIENGKRAKIRCMCCCVYH